MSSKSQLLDVLANVQGVQMISVTSRNMRIWKIEPNKATNILQDEEVRSALKSYKGTRCFIHSLPPSLTYSFTHSF